MLGRVQDRSAYILETRGMFIMVIQKFVYRYIFAPFDFPCVKN